MEVFTDSTELLSTSMKVSGTVNTVESTRGIQKIVPYRTQPWKLLTFSTRFLHPLLTDSHTTTRCLGALGASSACHLRHCAPTVRYALLYKHNLCGTTTLRPGHNRCNRKFDFSRFLSLIPPHMSPPTLFYTSQLTTVWYDRSATWIE
ncbi:unnamed protein product [Sphacelaria rigidula]